jgi:two-component system LytT family response regulator
MKTLRVLVADDEKLARQRIVRLLGELDGVIVCGECTNADEVAAMVEREEVDVALLDIEMPGASGMEAFALFDARAHAPRVIFCTAHERYAVEAFERGAVDYVLKPIDIDRLRKAIDRARAREAPERVAPLAITTVAGVVLVDASSITHAALDGALVTIFTDGGAEHITGDSLNELERKLPHLVRVHRRALVALEHVARLEPVATGGYVAHTKTGHFIDVSRQAARALRRRLGLRKLADET